MLKNDTDCASTDESRRLKYSKKFAKRREEKRKSRAKEQEDDELNAKREFELLYPGVATLEEKLQQARELEGSHDPENIHEYTLKAHKDLEFAIKAPESLLAPQELFQVDLEEDSGVASGQQLCLELPEEVSEVPPAPSDPVPTQADHERLLESLKALLKQVPKHRQELYPFPLSWNALAQNRILDKKLGPFVGKLFIEYLGQDDHSLVQLVARMVSNHEDAYSIERKVGKFLEDDATVSLIQSFVKRIWRMLVFEHLKLQESLSY